MPPRVRPNNRLLVLCTSINDVTAWPFWKFLQMKKIRGVTDMALLAFNSEGGSFEARIDGEKYSMKNYAKVKGYHQEMFQAFLDRWYDPGRSYFIYGGHGMGDYLEFEQHRTSMQVHELAALLGRRHFEAILFDACFMASLDCAYHLRNNTGYIGACEGYMWEPDTALDYHVFSTSTASAMSRFRDPRLILDTIQREYTSKAPRGDFSVLDTTHVAELRQFVKDHVMQRVYNRATLYSPLQQERLSHLAESALEESIRLHGQPGGDAYLQCLLTPRHASSAPTSPDAFALANSGRLSKKQRIAAAIQFEHSLYPSESLDKHLVDLRSYLLDMCVEEDAERQSLTRKRRPIRKAAAGAWSPSRAYQVNAHGCLPPVRCLTPSTHTAGTDRSGTGETGLTTGVSGRGGDSPSKVGVSTGETGRGGEASTDGAAGSSGAGSLVSTHPRDSARYGLDLFDKVVLRHVAPRSNGIYASRLGGLSVAVHEYSAMSKPAEPWRVSKTILGRKVKSFLAKGSLEEVVMGGLMASAGFNSPTAASEARASASASASAAVTAPSAARGVGGASSSSIFSSSPGTETPATDAAFTTTTTGVAAAPEGSNPASIRMLTCHQPLPFPSAPHQSVMRSVGDSASHNMMSTPRPTLPSAQSAEASTASSSWADSLSSSYASASSTSSCASYSSSSISRAHSADRVMQISRAAGEAAALLDRASRN